MINQYWFCIKLSLLYVLFIIGGYVLYNYSELPIPASLWNLMPYTLHLTNFIKILITTALIVTSYFWMAEKKMAFTSTTLSILSTLILSIEESNGIYNRNMTISAVFWAIAIAYIANKKLECVERKRLNYPLQIVAITYVLSGLSKLFTSGLSWVVSGKYFTLQIIKNHYANAFSTGNFSLIADGYSKANFFMNHIWLVNCVFIFTFIVEFFSFIIIIYPNYKIVYGCLILLMHLGIYLIMDIHIIGIFSPMLIVIFNPLYLLYITIKKIRYSGVKMKN